MRLLSLRASHLSPLSHASWTASHYFSVFNTIPVFASYTARPEYHTQLAKMSFDKIFDLTAGVYFNFHDTPCFAALYLLYTCDSSTILFGESNRPATMYMHDTRTAVASFAGMALTL